MTSSAFVTSRRWAARWTLAVLLVVLAPLAPVGRSVVPPAVAAEQAWLQAEARLDGGVVIVRAVLFDANSQPIVGRSLTIKGLGGSTTATTEKDGWTTAQLAVPEGQEPGKQTITLHFAGDSQYSAVDATTTLELVKNTSTTLTAQVDEADKQLSPGAPLEVTGVLTFGAGDPIENATIIAQLGKQTSEPSITDADGKYVLRIQVPEDAAPGKVTMTVSFKGATDMSASSAKVSLEIMAPGKDPSEPESTAPVAASAPEAPTSAPPSNPGTATSAPAATAPRTVTARAGLIMLGGAAAVLALGGLVLVLALRHRGRDRDDADFIDEEETVPAPQDIERPVAADLPTPRHARAAMEQDEDDAPTEVRRALRWQEAPEDAPEEDSAPPAETSPAETSPAGAPVIEPPSVETSAIETTAQRRALRFADPEDDDPTGDDDHDDMPTRAQRAILDEDDPVEADPADEDPHARWRRPSRAATPQEPAAPRARRFLED